MPDLITLEREAHDLLHQHGLTALGWRFAWDRALTRFGSCHYGRRRITLSKPLALANSPEENRDTLLHEIAHAIAGPRAGHGNTWKAACRTLGARPHPTAPHTTHTPPARYVLECEHCGYRWRRYRRPHRTLVCAECGDAMSRNGSTAQPLRVIDIRERAIR
jgi:predicted SprT family Zn-dependent metalloprotease